MEISVADIIEKIKKANNFKTDKEVAEYLNIATNTINNIKTRNSLGTFLEKIIANYPENDFIGFDYLLLPSVTLSASRLFLKSNQLAIETNLIDSFENLLEQFVLKGSVLAVIFQNLQTLKGKQFFLSFFDVDARLTFSNMLLLQKVLEKISESNIDLNHPKKCILDITKTIEISMDLFGSLFNDTDLKRFIELVDKKLDDISCYEIITCLPILLKTVNNEIKEASERGVDKILKPIKLD
ncbi:helix-turn-helix domain-containing protein [Sulfuricurvum sp.]|uniref:helix-turn-helix domain-containing protein n=1 Tax=Sulfuricurvum sp. TaxID=2025608 RepID=UPI00260F41BE|nr:helix-turn-helix domain-containing protein [Sulfuricurvum sp.]MDD2838504.1 helix-turn-helix domain-containing protein [Sulfuricurvum sp.]MDD3597428.1 helix-turn-helix domain-containing protein [Sulfuricurvum sp.]